MTKGKFIQRYKDKDKKVQEYMSFVADAMIERHSEVPDSYMISLDVLATNLDIMVKCVEEMSKEGGLTDDDKYHGKKKSASLQTYFQAQGYVNIILSNFGLHPLGKSKISKNKEEINVQEFLDNLTA